MLPGCTVMLMHWLMLPANRYGSSARSQLSLGEHLPHTSTHQSTDSTREGVKQHGGLRPTRGEINGRAEHRPGQGGVLSRTADDALHCDQVLGTNSRLGTEKYSVIRGKTNHKYLGSNSQSRLHGDTTQSCQVPCAG